MVTTASSAAPRKALVGGHQRVRQGVEQHVDAYPLVLGYLLEGIQERHVVSHMASSGASARTATAVARAATLARPPVLFAAAAAFFALVAARDGLSSAGGAPVENGVGPVDHLQRHPDLARFAARQQRLEGDLCSVAPANVPFMRRAPLMGEAVFTATS